MPTSGFINPHKIMAQSISSAYTSSVLLETKNLTTKVTPGLNTSLQ